MLPLKGDGTSSKRRSEVVTVRLDPRLKYLAEIAARKQRRTLSGYIEWAVEKSLDRVHLKESVGEFGNSVSVAEAERNYTLWDVDEAERVMRLAFNFPELLTFEEQLLFRLIKDCGAIWRGNFSSSGRWEWGVSEHDLIWDRLKEHWETFKGVAADELPREKLPTWAKFKPAAGRMSDALDEDIPF